MITNDEKERRMGLCRQLAAQLWCHPTTEHIEMDVALAEVIAENICEISYAPHLGCATTGELLAEILARVDISYKTLPDMPRD